MATAEKIVGEKDGRSCMAVTNPGAPSSSSCRKLAAPSNSAVKVHPAATRELVPRVATEVASGTEVPNDNSSGQQFVAHLASDTEVTNNSSGQQLVPHSPIDIPSCSEAPNNSGPQFVAHLASNTEVTNNNNSSGQQLVPHSAINIPSSIEAPNNPGPQDGNNADNWKLAAFWGLADCATAMMALSKNPPSRSNSLYFVAELIVFAAGILGILAALWASSASRRRRTAERVIMYTSIVVFIFGLVLDFYA